MEYSTHEIEVMNRKVQLISGGCFQVSDSKQVRFCKIFGFEMFSVAPPLTL